jgi:hypothetical protein
MICRVWGSVTLMQGAPRALGAESEIWDPLSDCLWALISCQCVAQALIVPAYRYEHRYCTRTVVCETAKPILPAPPLMVREQQHHKISLTLPDKKPTRRVCTLDTPGTVLRCGAIADRPYTRTINHGPIVCANTRWVCHRQIVSLEQLSSKSFL